MIEFLIKLLWNVSLGIQWTIGWQRDRREDIASTSVDQDVWRQMASLDHNKLTTSVHKGG